MACNFFFGISNSSWTIMLFISLNGLAQGTGWPGCIGSLAFWYKRKQRGSILGIWSTCYQLGSVMATAFAAFMLGIAGWRWSFFGASIILLVIWFIVLILHPNRPGDVSLEPIEVEEDDAQDKSINGDKLNWDKNVILTIITMGVIYFCIKFLRYALWSWVPFFLNRNFKIAGDDAGYLSIVFDICGFLGVILSGYLSDKIFKGRRAFISFIMLVFMTLSFFMMYSMGSAGLLYFTISLGLAGFMLYGPDALISGVGAIDVGSKKGALAAAGIINGMGSIGPIFQEQAFARMYRAFNQDLLPIFMLFVVIAAISAALTSFLWIQGRRGRSKL
ncbi:MFS transporter [Spirochaetota bacterium]